MAVGAGYGVVIMRRFGAPAVVEGDRYSLPVTAVIALAFGAVLGAAAAVGVALSWTEPYWVPEPILILVIYLMMGSRERIHEKALGTAAGAAAAVVVAIIAPPPLAYRTCRGRDLARGDAAGDILADVRPVHVRARTLLAAPDDVAFEAEERGLQILAGIALLIVGLAVLHASRTGWPGDTRNQKRSMLGCLCRTGFLDLEGQFRAETWPSKYMYRL